MAKETIKNTRSVFDDFTNLYEIQKTLRFELKPVGKTEELLKTNQVFKKDKTIDDSYNQAKFYFDEMHREFIGASFANAPLNIISSLVEAFVKKEEQEKRGNKNDSNKEWDKARKEFCEKIAAIFNTKAKELEEKDGIPEDKRTGVKYLLSAKILNHLKQKFPKEKNNEFINKKWPNLFVKNQATGEKQYIFDSFDKFTTYLGKFQETKNNLYTADDKATSVASRIIDNFVVFQGNKNKFENKLKAISSEANFMSGERDIFKQDYYTRCFVQSGIDKYNEIIGNLNKKIKEFRDQEEKKAKESKQEFKKGNFPLLIELDKQILSYKDKDKEKELIEKDDDLSKAFEDFVKNNNKKIKQGHDFLNDFCNNKFSEEYNKIYLQKKVLNTIFRKWLVDANALELLLPQTSGKKEDKNAANIKKYISLSDIKSALEKEEKGGGLSGDIFKDKYYNDNDDLMLQRGVSFEKRFGQFLQIWKFEFENLFKDKKLSDGSSIKGYDSCLEETKKINWSNFLQRNKKEELYKKEVEKIKQYADISLGIYQMLKYFVLGGKDAPVGSDLFYGEFNDYYHDFEFIKYYDALRNYITKKPFNSNKIKLNFENGQLLSGFDKNKEKEKFGIVIRKNNLYYLGILMDEHKDIFEKIEEDKSGDFYEKMEYKLFPDPKRMIPKIAFAEKNKKLFGLTEEIQNIKKEYEEFQKEKEDKDNWKNKFNREKLNKLIGYYQRCLESGGYKKEYGFIWKKPQDYAGIGDFNDEIERQNYKVSFRQINSSYTDDKINKGELYLFKIYNKDLSNNSTGIKNIHTLYFLNLFTLKNLNAPILKLAGGAEIFFREKSDNLSSKKDKKNKVVLDHKRYSSDKIFLHISIKINRGDSRLFNKQINSVLSGNKNINIVGIDRGEKNLLYYSVINQKGEILDQGSLNEINGVDYFIKLNQRERERIEAKQSWNQIEQIKDLKRGYLSCVIHKVCTLIDKYNAIVVLEDLNMRFKQIRGGIEKSVYQQFEKALIDKLGHMVFKNRKPEEIGGVLKGYQLAAPFESFEKMYKQTGILFYTQADYTSVTDPVSGFRKNIYIGNSWSQEKIKEAINKFKSIRWDNKIGGYAFTYNSADFTFESKYRNKRVKNKPQETISKEWILYSTVPRIERFRNDAGYWEYNSINLSDEFKELFKLWDFNPMGDILKQIREKEDKKQLIGSRLIDKKQRDFYHRFIYLFNLVLQLRNSFSKKFVKDEKGNLKEIGDDIDFIASPVYPFFSMEAKSKNKGIISKLNIAGFDKRIKSSDKNKIIKDLNGDANGAYNIARKGIIILEKIKNNFEKPDLFITKNEWDKFVQSDMQNK